MAETVLLTIAGFQFPVIPFVEVDGKIGAVVLAQIGVTVSNNGVIAFTLIVNVVVVAQIPSVGVKVYMAETVLLTVGGFQVPVIPFVEVRGKIGGVES